MRAALLPLFASAVAAGPAKCTQYSLVLTADTGDFSGLAEAKLVLEKMTQVTNITKELSHCARGYEGMLGTHCTVLITTGIGVMNAAACTVEVLSRYRGPAGVKEAVYMGTSGWSVSRGGLLDPDDCGSPRVPKQSLLHSVGDVCVSSFGVDYTCGFEPWATNATTECMLPLRSGHDQSNVFSECNFVGSSGLTKNILAAQEGSVPPPMPAKLQGYLDRFWSATWDGFGVEDGPKPAGAAIHGSPYCGEAASATFWSGVPGDSLCRRFLAHVASESEGRTVSHTEMTCVSAMEIPGWMPVLIRRGGIPFANIRGASNYALGPIVRDGSNWVRNNDWISEGDNDEFHKLGYQYAIHSTTNVLLRYFGVAP
eukprot:TRINITY_DN5594_c0_g1_i1.p1 TRINITY_DN5594_c0_g1~~TRINITY_DN5594_c0_g1_i1.p1  ORF type:complete len:369 (+),score=118.11 TRINITY_DN5594_c0_g1_i1:107-1213(+)